MKDNFKILTVFAIIICLFGGFFFTGCSNNIANLVNNSQSEIVENYFCGKGEDFSVSISSGKRESPYIYDGKSERKVDFSIVKIVHSSNKSSISADVVINEKRESINLSINPINGNYLFDLKIFLDINDKIYLNFNNQEIPLTPLSKTFKISYNQAVELAITELETPLKNFTQANTLQAECYLRILDNENNNFDKVFWIFSIYGKNKASAYCIIDPNSGNIIK